MDQISDLPAKLSKPAKRAFTQEGYVKLEQFAGLTEAEVLALHGVGPTAIVLLRQALAEKGLAFRE
ncbi:DNA-binding protein [Paenibacillus sp. ATY16]|uniref:DNA-binding protein n=1 Tax=Paenibacillus sp. ATY16 TaxID=1759312 RepID=UPI00200EA4CC|nr:DNA-binding protein [Paenibacillus sp. ATY16]MCK9858226.1 DNA-binding protein [Paenibacillus sp. ATY16]